MTAIEKATARSAKGGKGGQRRKAPRNRIDGWLVLDKPEGFTSTEALGVVKRLLRPEKAGHAGTLDPLATGILPIALGEATKTVPYVVDGRKTYRFTVRWGSATDTDDAEGEEIAASPSRPTREAIEAVLPAFRGPIQQVPPRFSAIKVNGERAYDLAREGAEVTLAARPIDIHRLEVVACPDADHAVFEAECGKGGYVRALARDIGERLGCFGHVTQLRRTRVGPFAEADALTLEAIEVAAGVAPDADGTAGSPSRGGDGPAPDRMADDASARVGRIVRPVESALWALERIEIDGTAAQRLRRGQSVIVRGRLETDAPDREVYAMSRGALVALGTIEGGELHPIRVFKARGGRWLESEAGIAVPVPAARRP